MSAARHQASCVAIEGRGVHYHAQVAAAFRRFAQEEPDRFACIDASGAPESTHQAIMQALEPLLGPHR